MQAQEVNARRMTPGEGAGCTQRPLTRPWLTDHCHRDRAEASREDSWQICGTARRVSFEEGTSGKGLWVLFVGSSLAWSRMWWAMQRESGLSQPGQAHPPSQQWPGNVPATLYRSRTGGCECFGDRDPVARFASADQ